MTICKICGMAPASRTGGGGCKGDCAPTKEAVKKATPKKKAAKKA